MELVRLNVNMNLETAEALSQIAAYRGLSYTEAVRRAIAVYSFIEEETKAGRIVQTRNPNGSAVRELHLL